MQAEVRLNGCSRGHNRFVSASGVRELIDALPSRYKPGNDSLRGRFRLSIGRVRRDVMINGSQCAVGAPDGRPDAEIRTDERTWREIDAGKISGIEAFAAGRLNVRGGIDRSLEFEPLFTRPDAGAMTYSIENLPVGRQSLSVLQAGDPAAPALVLLHGLGATKASWLPIVPDLAQSYRVLALDLPGFGSSSKPRGRYDARWFSEHVFALLSTLGIERAFVAGNSMGGRVAMEMGLAHPEIVEAIACLCPATAFSKRPFLRLVRLSRPELGVFAHVLPRSQVRDMLLQLFADPSRLSDDWFEAAIDDFLRTWRSPRARMAFFAAARHIYLEEPEGEMGFWVRLATMHVPALYVYGNRDVLITPRFARRVERSLPSATVAVWDDCGHVPQIEHPARVAETLQGFFRSAREPVAAGAV